ncbi:hypothetical protein [uncultured Kocuria sp.]|uniref:hypothetical protein n=1 Tax=uncultured Kocuria sp. TaxID=259305 RepID=UPI0026338BF3|nr:hypothetical protein [uncultured Kocuria sp.]
MPAPAVRRLALAAAPAVLACALAAPPAAAAASPEPTQVVRVEVGPGPVVGDPRTADALDLVPASRVVPEPGAPLTERGQGPILAVGLAVLALVGAFVAGLSRRPDPAD